MDPPQAAKRPISQRRNSVPRAAPGRSRLSLQLLSRDSDRTRIGRTRIGWTRIGRTGATRLTPAEVRHAPRTPLKENDLGDSDICGGDSDICGGSDVPTKGLGQPDLGDSDIPGGGAPRAAGVEA